MSGIAGIYYLNGRPVREEIDRMVEGMEHRGPDGINTWRDGSVSLGHCMLETTPEDQHDSLPMVDRSGHFAITADARIDNRIELKKKLDMREYKDRPITDTEIILAAYKQWGRGCPKKLLGAFAFAIWDMNKNALVLSRDHIGIKPLYYSHMPGSAFLFSSEIRPILNTEDVPVSVNDMRIADMVGYFNQDKEGTFFDGVKRLLPAHTAHVSRENYSTNEYWQLDPNRRLKLSSEEEYIERFRDLFFGAVSSRMRNKRPIGSMLSGGLDSSSIACAASQLNGDGSSPIHTFSAVHPSVPETDESHHIQEVLHDRDFESHLFSGDQHNPILPLLDTKSNPLDEPPRNSNPHIPWLSYKIAQEKGVRVVLSGINGDGTVSHGRHIFREFAEKGKWLSFLRELLYYSQNMGKNPISIARPYIIHFVAGPLIRYIQRYDLFCDLIQSITKKRSDKGSKIGQDNLIRRDFAEKINWKERRDCLLQDWKVEAKSLRDLHYRSQTSGIKQEVLEEYNHLSARFETEVRIPFWDRDLVEFCLALPPELKLKNGWNRRIHRLGLEGVLPQQVQWRKDKSDMSYAFDHTLVSQNKTMIESVISSPRYIDEYVDMDVLRSCYEEVSRRSGQPHNTALLHLKTALSLEVWLDQIENSFTPKA